MKRPRFANTFGQAFTANCWAENRTVK